jgi:hypothetical protein
VLPAFQLRCQLTDAYQVAQVCLRDKGYGSTDFDLAACPSESERERIFVIIRVAKAISFQSASPNTCARAFARRTEAS